MSSDRIGTHLNTSVLVQSLLLWTDCCSLCRHGGSGGGRQRTAGRRSQSISKGCYDGIDGVRSVTRTLYHRLLLRALLSRMCTDVLYIHRRTTFRLVLRDPDHPECLRCLEQRSPTNPPFLCSIDSVRLEEASLIQKITQQE